MSEVAHYYPIDVTRRTQITREQFEARQEAARKRWQATMTSRRHACIIVPWGSSSVAHGAVSTFETIREWMEANNFKASCAAPGRWARTTLNRKLTSSCRDSPRISTPISPPTKCPNCWRACSCATTCAPIWRCASTAPTSGTARRWASRAFPPPKSSTSGSYSSV